MRPLAYLYPKLRKVLLLDGEWDFREDPDQIGVKAGWFLPQNRQAFTRKVAVPSSWRSALPDLADYGGTAWYAKGFVLEPLAGRTGAGGRVLLDFTAVDYEATVWVNGDPAGRHEGGYSRFVLDVTDLVAPGENWVVVRVHDPVSHAHLPHGKQGGSWYEECSGVWGSVYVEYLRAPVFLNDAFVKPTSPEGGFALDVQVKRVGKRHRLPEATYRLRVTARLLPLDEALVAAGVPGAPLEEMEAEHVVVDDAPLLIPAGVALKRFSVAGVVPGARPWTPEAPFIYSFEFVLFQEVSGRGEVVDSFSTEVGFRTISAGVGGDGLVRLNGVPVFLRGVLDQAFYPETGYVPTSDEFVRQEILLTKHLGANLNRKHVKVEDPRYLYWCDHLGLLYWAEPANFLLPTPRGFRVFERELVSMVLRDRNHPCVVIWGIFNEEWGAFGLFFGLWHRKVRELVDLVRKLDDSRLVVDNSGWAHVDSDLNDYHLYPIPPRTLRSFFRQLAHAREHPELNFATRDATRARGLPVVVSEYGVCGLPDLNRLRAALGGTWPRWFERNGPDGLTGKCFPRGVEERARHLPRALVKDLSRLAKTWQWHQFMALKFLNEEMRRAGVAGWVVTELADLEWEFNGLLDFARQPKVFHEVYRHVNADCMVVVRLPARARVATPGTHFLARCTLSLFPREKLPRDLAVVWNLVGDGLPADAPGSSGSFRVPTRTHEPYELAPFEVVVPSLPTGVWGVQARLVVQVVAGDDALVCENFEPVTIVDPSAADPVNFPLLPMKLWLYDPRSCVGDLETLRISLGVDVSWLGPGEAPERGEVVVATGHDARVNELIGEGHAVLLAAEFVDVPGARKWLSRFPGIVNLDAPRLLLPELLRRKRLKGLPFSLRSIPVGDHWQGMTSLHLADDAIFSPVPRSGPLFWDVASMWPASELEVHAPPPGIKMEVVAGFVVGWVNELRGTCVRLTFPGGGRLVVTTWKLLANLDHPLAKIVLFNLLSRLRD
ncbi:MAG: hypothetical protein Kow0069_30750 [Promethearchaeota archaeon]